MSVRNAIPGANVRSSTYYVVRASAPCTHCGMATRLLALAMPGIHETLDLDASVDGGDDPTPEWQRVGAVAFLFYVQEMSHDVERRLRRLSQHFRPARSPATQNTYWANHCEHCGTLLGDHELHGEPDGAFSPSSEAAAADIELDHVNAPLQAAASGYTLDPEFLRFMRQS